MTSSLWIATIGWMLMASAAMGASSPAVILGNRHFRYVIAADGRNQEFVGLESGRNFLRSGEASPCALVRCGATNFVATGVEQAGDQIVLRFGGADVEVRLRAAACPDYVVLSVEAIQGEVDALTFLNIPLSLEGRLQEEMGACALSLNLITRVDALPVLQRELRATAEKRFGLVGAKVAIVAAPVGQMLAGLQEALVQAGELPVCRVAGPWARDIPFNHGSYLFNFGSLTETNVQDWIDMTRRVGFTQIDNHGGGGFFRFGDLELNRSKWPEGWESFRRIVGRLREAGIGSILHTYGFFIDKGSKYVTPVPDGRLDAFRTFTLAEPLTAEATEIAVEESTAGLSLVTGFFEHNSVVLHVGDELVTFGGFSKTAPWRFTEVKRGAHGTRASPHERGAKARQLKECFGLFVPDPESSLFEEIAANHADVVNRCGFEGVYLDAIDGSSILRGPEECWYWADKFVVEIQRRLVRPVGMEMSAMWHHFWQYRTRWQAWDTPRRGHQRFMDLHAAEINGGLMLPLHLGWWELCAFDPPQVEPSYPDVMEQLGARLIGWDAGISLTAGIDQGALRRTPLFARGADTLRTCEELRRGGGFDEASRAKLRDPNRRFALCTTAEGRTRFREIVPLERVVATKEPWSGDWVVTNRFATQPARFRIEVLMGAAAAVGSNAVVVADLAREGGAGWKCSTAQGVGLSRPVGTDRAGVWAVLSATNSGRVPRHAAWVRWERRAEPELDLRNRQALQVEVDGDGSGAMLAIRLESPLHVSHGAVADRYLTLDFTGRRTFDLVETESSRWSDFVWGDGKSLYGVYRERVDFGRVSGVSVWLQDLPPDRETRMGVGPVQAVPLRPVALKHPRLVLNGQVLEFRTELGAGGWIEGNAPEDCQAYTAKGTPLGPVNLRGRWPVLVAGPNAVAFRAETEETGQPRVRVIVYPQGEAL